MFEYSSMSTSAYFRGLWILAAFLREFGSAWRGFILGGFSGWICEPVNLGEKWENKDGLRNMKRCN